MSLIVSLTSTSVRLEILKYTLFSLADQSLSADRVVLNLSADAYLMDDGIKELPHWLVKMVDEKDLEINWVKNTGPYRKLLPVYKNADETDLIITCDDDVIYGSDWLKTLVSCSEKNPDAIVCGRARKPVKNIFGIQQSYINWPLASPGAVGKDLVPIGVSGVVYKKSLLDEGIMNSDDFLNVAPKQDDLWFDHARKVAGVDAVVAPDTNQYVYEIITNQRLYITNVLKKASEWNKFSRAVYERLMPRAKGVIGLSACDNDLVLKKLRNYSPVK